MSIASDIKYDLERIIERRGEVKVRIAANPLPVPVDVTSITDDGLGAATVVATGHGFSTGNSVAVFGARESRFNGVFSVTVSDANTFTYAVTGSVSATATGDISAVLDTALPSTERFYSLGHIADGKVGMQPRKTRRTTTGKSHTTSWDMEISMAMMQTSDAEFLALNDLLNNQIDVIVFPKACSTQHTRKGELVADLKDGFIVYGAVLGADGELDLAGSDSGINVTVPFTVGRNYTNLTMG